MSAPWYRIDGDRAILTLHIQPGAKRTGIAGIHDGALKIRIAAPPVEGQANAKLLDFLKKAFDVPSSRVILRQGSSGRRKVVEIHGSRRSPDDMVNLSDKTTPP
ncbi:MAG: YggU family protein [Nitrosomonadales bacterium]|nr:MAG: YggU family protein [Nitrosomonadales bacterium]